MKILLSVLGVLLGIGLLYSVVYNYTYTPPSLPAADYTFPLNKGISYVYQDAIFQTMIRDRIEGKVIHFTIKDNPGGWVSTFMSLQQLKKARNLVYTAEASGLVASAAYEMLTHTYSFKVDKKARIVIHTGYLLIFNSSGGFVDIPISFPTKLTDSNGEVFFAMLESYLEDSKYLTKEQWADFLKPRDIDLTGKAFCEQNTNKLLLDTPTHCILKGLDYPGGVLSNE